MNLQSELRQLLADAFSAKPLETVPSCISNDPVLESDRRVGNLTEDVLLLRLFLIQNQLVDHFNSLVERLSAAMAGPASSDSNFEGLTQELDDLKKAMKQVGDLFWMFAISTYGVKKDQILAIRANWEMVVLAPKKPEPDHGFFGVLPQVLEGLLGLRGIQVGVHVIRT